MNTTIELNARSLKKGISHEHMELITQDRKANTELISRAFEKREEIYKGKPRRRVEHLITGVVMNKDCVNWLRQYGHDVTVMQEDRSKFTKNAQEFLFQKDKVALVEGDMYRLEVFDAQFHRQVKIIVG